MENISLILNGKYELAPILKSIKWSGRKGTPARSVTAVILDAQSDIDVTRGESIVFAYQGAEMFRGMIMSLQRSQSTEMTFTAYDSGIYLSNNKDTFTYEGKTVQDIFIDVCKRFNLKYGGVAETSYKIQDITKSKTTAWDVIADAISQEYKATGNKYFVRSEKGVLNLIKRKEEIIPQILEYIDSYTQKNSIENIKTRLKIYTKEDEVFAVRKNEALEQKIGIFQEIEQKNDDTEEAKLNADIDEKFKEISTPEDSLRVHGLGIPGAISGAGVFVRIERLGVKRAFWIDEDSHTFDKSGHRMDLTLNKASR